MKSHEIKEFLYSCLTDKQLTTLNRLFESPHEIVEDVLITEDQLESFGKQAVRVKIDFITGLYRPIEESPRQSQDNLKSPYQSPQTDSLE